MQQISLMGFEPAKPATDRLFLALFPPADVAANISSQLHRVCESSGINGRAVRTERLHLTLHHVGDFPGLPAETLRQAISAGEILAASPVEVMLDKVSCFDSNPRKPMLVLTGGDNEALRGLQQQLLRCLARYLPRFKPSTNFTPHVTILYGDPAQGCMRHAEQTIEPIRWQATEFVLVHSLLGKTVHRHLARWPLQN
ncbi:RNA 2',3'-cyclic phosphodiesterase [Permianibacter aggregans]|uniref:RNA 2',3'-cyclic phosphodiesterase n=1 Tax=Permianibacter aggregans TaxID=1510150 RepID=A0A4R6US84_9GAMM|nr:RNA 2',3'-cyclic phosphodiesterase [Permianibacter aggregans]QGX41109.1 RNA 2',3'-cyclic phosphodiesterase [Permianibacter aggregans]TDQ48175.1 2'-5' RNA ligase [Permianibacter aggregans]